MATNNHRDGGAWTIHLLASKTRGCIRITRLPTQVRDCARAKKWRGQSYRAKAMCSISSMVRNTGQNLDTDCQWSAVKQPSA